MTPGSQPPNPALVFETLNRYQHTMALKGAIDLELFTHIADGASTPAALAARIHASERGVRILCDFLTIMEFLTKSDSGYTLTQDSAMFLNKHSPAYMGTVANFVASPVILDNYRDVAALVRKGGTLDGAGSMEPENEIWVEFARSMVPVVMQSALAMAPIVAPLDGHQRKLKVLDIAAGHGMFGISVARHNPEAEIYAVDWKNVLEVALENAARAHVADRYHTIPGSAFDVDYGTGYDVVLIPNFLHHFAVSTNVSLLKKIRAAMNPGGIAATLEFIPNPDRVSPPIPASFSFTMLGSTQLGDAYTFHELDQMFREAGFGESRMQDLPMSPERLMLTAL